MSRFRHHKYTWSKPFGSVRHCWELISQQGAVHFHATLYRTGGIDTSCGIEFHSCTPTGDRAPDHIDCPLIGGRCWHDGSSLYAESLWQYIGPRLEHADHEGVFAVLEAEHDKHFQIAEGV